MEEVQLSTVLLRAADYIDAHGLRRGGFGRPGRPVCVNSAIAIGLGVEPSCLGWGPFFRRRPGEESLKVAEVVLKTGLLDLLPPAGDSWERRRGRSPVLNGRQALAEVARWADAPGRTREHAVRALRRAAFRLEKQQVAAPPAAPSLTAAA